MVLGLISITGVKHLRALLAKKNFSEDPKFLCTFRWSPMVIYNWALYNWKLSHHLHTVTLKPGLGVTQGRRKLYHQSSTNDYLLAFHSNHRPISHGFRDKRRYPSKIARKSPISPPPCI